MSRRIAIIVPCYRRAEYTEKCIKSLERAQSYPDADFFLVDDCSEDKTAEILSNSTLENKCFWSNAKNKGLRGVLLSFFKFITKNPTEPKYEYIVKMDSDCLVPKNWLNDIVEFLDSGWADIVSPNVMPSNAAMKHGKDEEPGKPGIRPSEIVGGLWAMRASLLEGIQFEEIAARGLTGAFSLLHQIILEKEPRVGWLPGVEVQDMGHWSGQHPDHVKSEEHREYSVEVGRRIAW